VLGDWPPTRERLIQRSAAIDLVRNFLTCPPTVEDRVIKSGLTSKAQTTIPLPVRTALRLEIGDELIYRIEGDYAIVTKAEKGATDDPFATFHEWSSEADR